MSTPQLQIPPSVGMTMQPKLSEEQKVALDAVIHEGKNIVVIAKAGTGKTTFSLQAAQQFYILHQKRTLLLTYNSELKVCLFALMYFLQYVFHLYREKLASVFAS